MPLPTRLPQLLLTTLVLSLILLLSTTPSVKAGEFDIGEVCGKLNGEGYNNQYLCAQDRESIVSPLLPLPLHSFRSHHLTELN